MQVSAEHGEELVYVALGPETVEWVISDLQGKEIRRRRAAEFTAEAISTLSVAKPWR